MKVTVSQPEKSQVTLRIEVEESELAKYLDQATQELGEKVKIDGFRAGKVPRDILEQKVGKEALRAHALDLGLPYFYADAVIQEKVPVVARPEIKLISDTPFVFEAVVAILPEVKIEGHDKIKIEAKSTAVEEKDVEDMLTYFRGQSATHTTVDRAAQMGDRVELDFEGFDPEGDVPLEGTASQNHPLVLGEKTMIPGFEEEVVGLKAGDEKTFEITFPEDYRSKKFQGKKVKFKLKVHKVEEVKLPEVTDEWIKEVSGEEKTPEQFKEDIKTHLANERERQERTRQENEFFEELLKKAEIELPSALVEEEIDFILDRTKMDIESKGLSWDQYEKFLESQKRNLRDEKRPQAEKQIKLRLILQHLCKVEGIEAEPAELVDRIEAMKLSYPEKEQAKIVAAYKEGSQGYLQLQNSIRIEKLLKKYLP